MAKGELKFAVYLTEGDYQILDFVIENNSILEYTKLNSITLPDGIDFRKGVIINGKGPIWLYVYLAHLCHPAAWVATSDPRLGAVVVESHVANAPSVGSIIPLDDYMYLLNVKNVQSNQSAKEKIGEKIIAFLGPPHSGKSVLMNALRLALRDKMSVEEYQRDFFIVRACPDGEGDWFADIPPEIGKTFRYKYAFDDDFLQSVCTSLKELVTQKRILFVDCGGKIDKKNQFILNLCTHAIIVSKEEAKISEWRGLSLGSELDILAEIISSVNEEAFILSQNPFRLRLGKLERGTMPIIPDELIRIII